MNGRLSVLTIICLFAASGIMPSGIAAADLTAGIGLNGILGESPSSAEAVAEISVSSTLLSSSENAVYAGFSGTANIDPSSFPGGFSAAADLLYSRLFGLDVAGVKLGFEGGHSVAADADSLKALLSFPVTLNGDALSFSFTPLFEYAMLSDGHVSAGAVSSLSFALGELIVKPVVSFSSVWYADGSRTYEAGPGFGISWYPGFPLTTEAGASYRRLIDQEGNITEEVFETGILASASPFDWLLLAGQADVSRIGTASVWETFFEASFFVCRSGVKSLSVPVHLKYSHDGASVYEIGAGLRYYF